MSAPEPMTEERLEEIEARAAECVRNAREASPGVWTDSETVAGEDVPALVDEVRRLRGVLCFLGSVFSAPATKQPPSDAVLSKTVEELDAVEDLGVRVLNACRQANIHTVADMARLTALEWLSFRNFGRCSLRRVREALEAEGLGIGALAPSGGW